MLVFRGGDYLMVGNSFYLWRSIADAADRQSAECGVKFPGSNRPPFFYSGCPYGEAIMHLIGRYSICQTESPEEFIPEFLPQRSKPFPNWEEHERKIGEIFGFDPSAQYANFG